MCKCACLVGQVRMTKMVPSKTNDRLGNPADDMLFTLFIRHRF